MASVVGQEAGSVELEMKAAFAEVGRAAVPVEVGMEAAFAEAGWEAVLAEVEKAAVEEAASEAPWAAEGQIVEFARGYTSLQNRLEVLLSLEALRRNWHFGALMLASVKEQPQEDVSLAH